MAKPAKFYYTFKRVLPAEAGMLEKVECHKWEASGEHTGVVYKVIPGTSWQGCDCPAWRECKHQKCVQEAFDSGKIDELWKWRWDEKGGWQMLDDIPSIEEVGNGH